MRPLFTALAAGSILLGLPAAATAQTQVGPYLAFHDEMDLGLGGFVVLPLPQVNEAVSFAADVGVFFPSDSPGADRSYLELNGNVLYRIPLDNEGLTPWILGGLRLSRFSADTTSESEDVTDTDLGLNVGGGLTFGAGDLRPFVGTKVEFVNGSALVLFGGLSFVVGGGTG